MICLNHEQGICLVFAGVGSGTKDEIADDFKIDVHFMRIRLRKSAFGTGNEAALFILSFAGNLTRQRRIFEIMELLSQGGGMLRMGKQIVRAIVGKDVMVVVCEFS